MTVCGPCSSLAPPRQAQARARAQAPAPVPAPMPARAQSCQSKPSPPSCCCLGLAYRRLMKTARTATTAATTPWPPLPTRWWVHSTPTSCRPARLPHRQAATPSVGRPAAPADCRAPTAMPTAPVGVAARWRPHRRHRRRDTTRRWHTYRRRRCVAPAAWPVGSATCGSRRRSQSSTPVWLTLS